jgi:hypothetical protein
MLYLDKNNQNSILMCYTKKGEFTATDHEIAASQETGKKYLYSIHLQTKKRINLLIYLFEI